MARDRALTPLQRAFCVARARNPSNATEAARVAGYKGGSKALTVVATRLLKDPRVKAEIARLQAELSTQARAELPEGAAMDRAEALRTLSTMARDGGQPIGGRVRAIRELGLLEGWYAAGGSGDPGETPALNVYANQAVVVWRGNGRGPEPSDG